MDLITTLTPYPPCQIQTENHKKQQAKIYKSDEWIKARKGFIKQNPVCVYCGKPATTPHHPTRRDYGTPAYIAEISDCEPTCKSCHLSMHTGKHLCPKCGKHWTKYEICLNCDPSQQYKLKKCRVKSEEEKTAIKNEAIALIHGNRNGMYVHIQDLVGEVNDNPEKYPLLTRFKKNGRRIKIISLIRDLGAEKTCKHGRTYVLRRLNL